MAGYKRKPTLRRETQAGNSMAERNPRDKLRNNTMGPKAQHGLADRKMEDE